MLSDRYWYFGGGHAVNVLERNDDWSIAPDNAGGSGSIWTDAAVGVGPGQEA